jgi:hypothetical protein
MVSRYPLRRAVVGGLVGALIPALLAVVPLWFFIHLASGMAQGPRASEDQLTRDLAVTLAFVALQGAIIGVVVAATAPAAPPGGRGSRAAAGRGVLAGGVLGAFCPALCLLALEFVISPRIEMPLGEAITNLGMFFVGFAVIGAPAGAALGAVVGAVLGGKKVRAPSSSSQPAEPGWR